ncbi:MAG TPA: hypothetical protein VGM87_22925 [Roseomonas sp.]|jgi:hypothetical protein
MRASGWTRFLPFWAACGMLAATAPAFGAGASLEWLLRSGDAGPLLAWEEPQTDMQPLLFACDADRRVVSISLVHEPEGAQDPMTVDTSWSSEGGHMQLAMQGHRIELDDRFVLTTETPLTPELGRLLAEGRVLRIAIGGHEEIIPLEGSAHGVATLREQCAPR